MHEPTHPPLLIFLLHYVRKLGSSEYVFRALPMLSGVLFPWFVYRWLEIVWSRAAGFAALILLTFSPVLVDLSAEVRGYTLALLLMAVALWCLEKALDSPDGRPRASAWKWMAGFGAALWLAVLAEFPVAFFCGGVGLYALLRSRRLGRAALSIWALTQVLCLATYVHLYYKQVKPLREAHQGLVNDAGGYFAEQFPREGQSLLAFLWNGTFGQFQLLMDWRDGASGAAVLFAVGLGAILWRRKWALAVLFLLPFAIAAAAAVARTHPYGNSRQTIVLAIFTASGVAIALDRLAGGRQTAVALALAAFVPAWYLKAGLNPVTWEPGERRGIMAEVVAYLRERAPAGSRILVEGHTLMLLNHYLDPRGEDFPGGWDRGEATVGGYRLNGPPGLWSGWDQVWEKLAEWRESHQIPAEETVWILDMAMFCPLCEEDGLDEHVPAYRRRVVRWDSIAVLAPVPAGYSGPPGRRE